MNTFIKSPVNIACFLLLCVLLQGCGLFTAGEKKLNEYCPGLNIKIDGVSWSYRNGAKVTVLNYDRSFQKKVSAYFADKSNGFAGDNPRRYLRDVDDNDDNNDTPAIAAGDSIVTKTLHKEKKEATVIYNATAGDIIIVE